MTIPRHEAEAIAMSLAVGAGVVVRDRHGIGEPVLARVVQITDEHVLLDTSKGAGSPVRFERATGFALLPGDHDRWQIDAPGDPGSEEYGGLLIQQARLQGRIEDIRRDLDLVNAALETADRIAARENGR